MTITESTLLAGARPQYQLNKVTVTNEGVGTWHSLWKVAGRPTAGSNPPAFGAGSGYIPTNATTGAIGQVNAAGGNELRAIALEANSTVAGKLIIYDRLWACSGFGTVITTAQNVTTPGTLTSGRLQAAGDYSDVEAWLEVYTAPGASTATWTVTALDGAAASRAYTYTHPANAETVGQMMPLVPPSAAAAGIQQITSFQASATSGTAGDIGITLMRRIAVLNMPGTIASMGGFKGALDLALARVRDDACLAAMVHCAGATTGIITADFGLSEVTP